MDEYQTSMGYMPSVQDTVPNLSRSNVFCPEAQPVGTGLNVIAVDGVLFYLDLQVIRQSSPRGFQLLLGDNSTSSELVIYVPETSEIIDVMAHFLYAMPYTGTIPSLSSFVEAIRSMPKYDIDVPTQLNPANPCYNNIMTLTPLFPLEIYVVAAEFNVEHLARAASSYLHSLAIPALSDEVSYRIGGVYMKRLVSLQNRRTEALKRIVLPAPEPHTPTARCTQHDQRRLSRAWALSVAHIIWNARAYMPSSTIQSTITSAEGILHCRLCKETVRIRLRDIIAQWINVESTI